MDASYLFPLNIHINVHVLLLKGFIKHIPDDYSSHDQSMITAVAVSANNNNNNNKRARQYVETNVFNIYFQYLL